MNLETFKKERSALLDIQAEYKKIVDQRYTEIVNEFLADNCPVEKHKVYNLIENGTKRRKYTRFVIYSQNVQTAGRKDDPDYDDFLFINVGGWWLDENSVPAKWDTMTVGGVSNPAVFQLADDQTAHPHPDADKEK